jgi:hypothetical protein
MSGLSKNRGGFETHTEARIYWLCEGGTEGLRNVY